MKDLIPHTNYKVTVRQIPKLSTSNLWSPPSTIQLTTKPAGKAMLVPTYSFSNITIYKSYYLDALFWSVPEKVNVNETMYEAVRKTKNDIR